MSTQNEGQDTVAPSGEDTTQKSTVTKSPEELQKIADDQKKRAERVETEKKEAEARATKAEAEAEDLRKKLAEAQNSKGDIANADISKIAEQFDVDPKFAEALATAIESKSDAKIKEAREKLEAEIAKRDTAEKQKAFETAFDTAFSKATTDVKTPVDKEAVKTVFLQRVKDNQELTVEDVVTQMYGGASGKSSSEDDVRGGGEGNGQAIDFATASKDPKKLKAIMSDPVAKQKYYNWRDSQGL